VEGSGLWNGDVITKAGKLEQDEAR
jgi:hypothetical protein